MSSEGSWEKEVETARLAAAAAAEVARAALGTVRANDATAKGRSDFVTEVDVAAQDAALGVIQGRHPDHRILGEEMTREERAVLVAESGPLWVVDPLDGTTNFLHGHPYFCASVGLVIEGREVVGAIDAPVLGERWWAAQGGGAWLQADGSDPMAASVASPDGLERSLVGTGFPFKALHLLPEYQGQFERILRGTAGIRRCGAAALDLCYLASGRIDAFWEDVLNPWDIAAGAIIVREAGGVVERIDGSPLSLHSGSVLGAASVALAAQLRVLLREQGVD